MERLPYIPPAIVREIRKMDLKTYLERYEPQELVRVSNGVYSTRSHDSLKISNGKWCWWSRGIGGRSALDYLIKVQDMSFQQAVLRLHECVERTPDLPMPRAPDHPKPQIPFILPAPYENNNLVLSYLTGRGISLPLLQDCIQAGKLYEDHRHNCVFVGFDQQGKARYGFIRSSSPNSAFLQDVAGSDKRFSFCMEAEGTDTLFLFESAIDLLSYITLEQDQGRDWKKADYLALSGVYAPARDNRALPLALQEYLRVHPETKNIVLCLDNDRGGHIAAQAIQERLSEKFDIILRFSSEKDYNLQLQKSKGIAPLMKMRGVPDR